MLLAQFSDQPSRGTTPAQWASRFFGATDSASDYYDKASYGQFEIAPATETYGVANDGIVGWVDLGYKHPVRDWTGSGSDYDASRRIVRDAVKASDAYVDYSAYDTEAPLGKLTPDELHVTVISAGNEAATGCSGAGEVWGHRSYAGIYTPTVDGVEVAGEDGGYTMFGEMQCTGGVDHMATLGIAVHELGHDLGMPDLYDYDGSSTGGVGSWSVMATGSWNTVIGHYQGADPALPDAFFKYYEGWTSPTAVAGEQRLGLAAAESSPAAVRLGDNPGGVDWSYGSGAGEYFLVENRQQSSYDAGLSGCGLLIYHVDEAAPNGNGDDQRRLVDVEEADDDESLGGEAGDPFLGGSFDEDSTPSSRYNDGSSSGASTSGLDDECASTMSASFVYQPLPDPDITPPETTIDSGPAEGATIRTDVTSFRFHGTAGDTAKLECRIDAAAFAGCASPKTYDDLSDGPHSFAVRAIDAAGNADSTPALRTFVVATGIPAGNQACERARAKLRATKRALERAQAVVERARSGLRHAKEKAKQAETPRQTQRAKKQLRRAKRKLRRAMRQLEKAKGDRAAAATAVKNECPSSSRAAVNGYFASLGP